MSGCPPKNVHSMDRAIRIGIGLFLLGLLYVGPHTQWGLLGLFPLMTGLSGRCFLYQLLGINTVGIGLPKIRVHDPDGESEGR